MNSFILVIVNVKYFKFSMKGQWFEYKISFKFLKDVSVVLKRMGFFKLNYGIYKKVERKLD